MDISHSFTPQKVEFMRAGGSYAVVFGKLQGFAAKTLGIKHPQFMPFQNRFQLENTGLTG